MTAAPLTATTDDRYRLPRSVVPRRYELRLAPDLDRATFDGDVRIHLDVVESVDRIMLNAAELAITAATVNGSPVAALDLDPELERVTLTLDGPLDAGSAVVELHFAGELNDKLRGFYRSTYVDADGVERTIATTQFEATDARRAFPCWDEPDFKAVFAVTLDVPADLLAVSNEAEIGVDELPNGRRRVRYADTMVMSTYLVAFVVGPLEITEAIDVDGTPLRVACVPGRQHMARFALDVGAHSLRFFSDYFGIPYPGSKLDLIALPDFAFGAMENLGCVTFRETALLVDDDTASRVEFERVADVVAHEIAHMWFGDLVTMKWWNGIWLNEAFATFMELVCVDAYRPEWQRWVAFSTSRSSAMAVDALSTTRAIEFPVHAPDEMEEMFDVLTYQKGASVVRMLEQHLGAEEFRAGIRRYMDEHRYANTETTDLWDAIEAATGEPARSTMDSWIFQGGFPLLSVERSADGSTLTLSQRRFLYRQDPYEADPSLWRVPVAVREGADRTTRLLLEDTSTTLDLGDAGGRVLVNSGGWGFFRVHYTSELLRALLDDLDTLDPIERFNLVSDTWASVVAGLSPVADFVALARHYGDDTDPNVWKAIVGGFDTLHRFARPDDRAAISAIVRELAGPAFARLGWEPRADDAEHDGILRGLLLQTLGTFGDDADLRAKAMELHEQYLEDRTAVAPDLVDALVQITARAGGEAEYTAWLDRWRSPLTPQEEVRYLYTLAAFPNEALVRRGLDLARTEVRTQNAPYLIGALLGHREHGSVAWGYVKQHWDELLAKYPDNSHSRMLETIMYLTGDVADVQSFIAEHPVKAAERSLQQSLERLAVHRALQERLGTEPLET